jgi:hypothetical protein
VSEGRLRLAPDEADQVPRLQAFRAAHPDVVIGCGGFSREWQARMPAPNDGEEIVTRYTLRELLDRLAGLLGEPTAT